MVYYEDIQLEDTVFIKRTTSRFEPHDMHIHDMLEICVILENESRYMFNDKSYLAKPGDVFMCRPFEAHWIYSLDANLPCTYILIYFSPSVIRGIPGGHSLLAPFYITQSLPAQLKANSPYAKAIYESSLQALLVMEQQQQNVWKTKQFLHFMNILVYLYEYVMEQLDLSSSPIIEDGLIQSIGYLVSHMASSMDMNEVIAISGLGKTLFYRRFKQLTQLTPNQFLNKLRLQIAVHALMQTHTPIIQIAMEAGYDSLSTFNKQFLAHYKMSPRSYRVLKGF
ncbi:AraC family transcriptional regulator [Paenibacillus psychroresistens]|uniref:AraC family transcriptional regulator n=1 Tax=Paenibacillus psychroresistens TaxID=1778678 RepID=A0A6B8RFQ7_9BACL|nr:AraC family transcriptional regulator [Paenibacillus psychroresistens]QGQ94564.1 AraC family transcriptional regulator [Paenibacillus psychroresistens]